MLEGDLETAKAQTVVALRLARELDNRVAQYYSVSVLGWHAANSRQPGLGARLLGAAAIMGSGAGADIVGPFEPFLHQAKASASSALGHEKYEAEFLRGKAMSRESALRLALGEPDPAAPDRADDVNAGPLAARELDVARLIADGLSNKEIGARLFISQPTVATHVRNIMNKLGYNSRAQIAGWVASGSP